MELNWLAELWGVLKDALVIPAVAFVGLLLVHHLWTAKATVVIQVPKHLAVGAVRFGLLAVITGIPLRSNVEHWFRTVGRQGHLVTSWRYRRGTETVFKCFVDHPGFEIQAIRGPLSDAGFDEITEGAGKPNRTWFLLREFHVDESDGNRNNKYYPN